MKHSHILNVYFTSETFNFLGTSHSVAFFLHLTGGIYPKFDVLIGDLIRRLGFAAERRPHVQIVLYQQQG
jgi:hypothetical protein